MIKIEISGESLGHVAAHIANLHKQFSSPTASVKASPPILRSDAAESDSSQSPQKTENPVTPQRKRGRPFSAATLAKRAAEIAKASEKGPIAELPKHGISASEMEEEVEVVEETAAAIAEVEPVTEEAEDAPAAEADITVDDVKVVITEAAKILTAKVLLPKAKVLLERYKAESVAVLKPEDRAAFIRGIQEMVTRSQSHK